MTVVARDGRDKPFSDWLRNQSGLDSRLYSLDVSDIDFTFHRFAANVDKSGTRDIKLMLDLEVKTFGKHPGSNQKETLFFRHQLLSKKGKLFSNLRNCKVTVWHFGQYVLRIIDGDRPDECKELLWGKFATQGVLHYSSIDEETLIKALRFELRPDSLKPLELRRHHITRTIQTVERKGLLFPMYVEEVHRS